MNSVRILSVVTVAVFGVGQIALPASVVAQTPTDGQPRSVTTPHQIKLKITIPQQPAKPVVTAIAKPTIAAKQEQFADFTLTSAETRDLKGIESSLYRGEFFKPSLENKRKCIVKRESEGYYSVRGGGGNNYYGAYQMSEELAQGATWMMLPEHKKLLGEKEAKRVLAKLRETPPNKWPRYYQDAAFSTIFNWESTASGAFHWGGGRWNC